MEIEILRKVLPTLRSDIPEETEYLLAERLELLMNDFPTASKFCGDRNVLTLPGGFFFNAEALVLKFYTQNCMVLQQGHFP
jgi:hypothetical protein